ncbi:MAG: hypothetical protein A2W35_17540 [Chloroflexi bacterium RBG_16_57_11]|nr:MAG: hypothetical protein A2W35_17540 [Chloroflexi bacterium RBG_16_57_11]
MADKIVEDQEGQTDEEALKAELEEDGELHDDEGKPLPWNHPKRVRKIYKDAKDGRKAVATLKELGFKPSDAAKLKGVIEEWRQFRTEYDEWETRQAAGDTTKAEDKSMSEEEQRWARIEQMLRAKGVKFNDPEDDKKEQRKESEANALNMTRQAHAAIMDSLEEGGLFEGLDEEDQKDLFEEFDFKIGQKLMRNPEARAKFLSGSLRPIREFINELLEKRGVTKAKPDERPRGTGITKLPPRGSSSPGSAVTVKKPAQQKEPQTVKEATEQMVAEMRQRRKDAAQN